MIIINILFIEPKRKRKRNGGGHLPVGTQSRAGRVSKRAPCYGGVEIELLRCVACCAPVTLNGRVINRRRVLLLRGGGGGKKRSGPTDNDDGGFRTYDGSVRCVKRCSCAGIIRSTGRGRLSPTASVPATPCPLSLWSVRTDHNNNNNNMIMREPAGE